MQTPRAPSMTSPPPSSADAGDRWRAAAGRLAAASTTLGRRFQEHTAELVGRVAPDWLDACAEAALGLRARAGWRGERLAHELFAQSPRASALLCADDLGPWTALALHCGAAVDEVEILRALPDPVGAWDAALRARWLDAALGLAPALSLAAYRELPAALDCVDPAARPDLLAAWEGGARASGAARLVDVTPMLPALLCGVPAPARAHAIALITRVAHGFPVGVPGLLRNLPRLYEAAEPARIADWAAFGLELASRHDAGGVAYFELASRTSEQVLAAAPTAVTLEEAQGVLRRVVHMLSGTPALPRASGRFTLRPPLEAGPASPMVALPSAVDRLETVEDNLRLFGLAAAQVAGRREFGTYDALPAGVETLRTSERPGALEGLFLLADGVRIAARLATVYPGIGAELRWAGDALIAARPDRGDLLDLLLALAIREGPPPHGLPLWLVASARLVLPALATLRNPAATAHDALAVAEGLCPLFADLGGDDQAPAVLPELVTLLLDAEPGEDVPSGVDGDPNAAGMAALPDDDDLPADLEEALSLLVDQELGDASGGRPLDAEALRRLAEALGAEAMAQARGDVGAQAGLYVTQLVGKRLADARRSPTGSAPRDAGRSGRPGAGATNEAVFVYDEWDHLIDDYRPRWCTLREVELPGDSGLYFDQALDRHADLVPEVRRHFQRLRPERYRRVHGLEDGEMIDLNAVVDARLQHRARRPGSAKLYASRRREERDVATLFLIDLSASTDETAPGDIHRIIDITKDALVIMAAALEEIGDLYAVYGFSGQGRDRVEVYPVKSFSERLTPAVQGRIGGLEPRGSTRMGAALRHALGKMAGVAAPSRHLVLLSDGFPQDLDYGSDRASHTYGIRDTAVALREVQRAGVRPFCITVDVAGHDYLREMCAADQYLVIEAVADLPRELPKIYQRLVRAA
jgi:nitric oxide reductase NorD protein